VKANRKFSPAAKVAAKYGVHRDSIKRWVRERGFPKPIYFNNRAYWLDDEIEAFDARLLDERTPPPPVGRAA
jgi:predicted DNA-binding transcriptional regulator AlpA